MIKLSFIFFAIFFLTQECCFLCWDRDDYAYSAYEPVLMSRNDLDAEIQLIPAQDIDNSGKIYVKDDLLFVGEVRKGFHIFDNSDMNKPINKYFLQVPGCTDIAIRNNVFYINQATDLVSIEYDNRTKKLNLVKRIENTFPILSSPDGFDVYDIHKDSVVVNWILKQ